MKKQNRLSLAFTLSLGLHGLLGLALLLRPGSPVRSLLEREEQPVEVELIDAEKVLEMVKRQPSRPDSMGQIVEQNEKRLNDEVPVDARFLSRHNQKVVRETQAQLHGKFKNSAESGGESSDERNVGKTNDEVQTETREEKQAKATEKEQAETMTSADGPVAGPDKKPSLKDLTPSFKPGLPRVESEQIAKGGGEGPSATDDHIKNVATGMQTLLSTREFVYYSYYNRIKDKLRQYWEPKIKEKMERILRQGRTIASSNDRITKIIIVLDDKGTLQRIQVIGPSGVQDLDEAAIEAFRAAAPFPNPPKGIVESDGTIKIRWDFILEANAGQLFDFIPVKSKVM